MNNSDEDNNGLCNLLPYLEHTVLKDISDIMRSGNFIDIEPGRTGEYFELGDMNNFEKACWTYISEKVLEEAEINEEMRKRKRFNLNFDDLSERIHILIKKSRNAVELMWESIGARFGFAPSDMVNNLRPGFKVVRQKMPIEVRIGIPIGGRQYEVSGKDGQRLLNALKASQEYYDEMLMSPEGDPS